MARQEPTWKRGRRARITAILYAGSKASSNGASAAEHVAKNVAEACDLIDRAALDDPDLIVLPESFNALGLQGTPLTATAEAADGPTVAAVSNKARGYRTYIACPIVERKQGKIFNSIILVDRTGRVLGSYHKMWPTMSEIEEGVTPGEDAWVAQTDFGKVGFAICFDLNFRPVGAANCQKGAKLVAFASMYRGGLSTQIWAYDFGVYLVSATPSEMSHFCNPMGRVLADLWHYQPIMTREIDLDFEVFHIDENERKLPDIRAKYGRHVELDIYGPEGVFMMTSRHPNKSVHDIIEEFHLEPRKAYFDRATRVRAKALRKAARARRGQGRRR